MIGQTLRHYQILDAIGSGGMGEIYLAEDTQLGRKVALKVVPEATAADGVQLARFQAEARTLASLNHPNIVTIHAVEEVDGVHFLAMEWVKGQTLDALIPVGGLPLSNLLHIALPLVDAVASAHAHGVVHRDLKPRNIMVTEEGRVKVLDFGLAKRNEGVLSDLDDSKTAPLTVTSSGTVTGTVPYMSPEQLQGIQVGPPSDVFALGVLLFEMATGRRPWRGDGTIDVAVAILRDPTPPLGVSDQDFGNELEDILKICLRKEAGRRYPSARQLHEALSQLESSWMSKTLEDTQIIAAVRQAHRVGWRRLLIAALLAVGALFVGWTWFGPDGASSPIVPQAEVSPSFNQRRLVVLPFRNLGAPEDTYFAAGISEEVTSRLAMVDGLTVISRTSAASYAESRKTTGQIGEELDVDFIVSGTVRWSQGADGAPDRVRVTPQLVRVSDDAQLWSNSYDRVLEDSFEVQSELALQVIQHLGINILPGQQAAIQQVPTDHPQAAQAFRRGQDFARSPDYTPELAALAISQFTEATRLDPAFILAWANLAQQHAQLIHFGHDRSPQRHQLAAETIERARELDPEHPEVLLASGYYHYWVNKDYTSARRDFLQASKSHPDRAAALAALAYVERRLGSLEASVRGLEQAITLDPRNASTTRELGNTYLFLGQAEQALRYFDRAIGLAPNVSHTYFTKAMTLWRLRGDLEGSRRILDSLPPGDHPLRPWCLFWQAIFEERYDLALEELRQVDDQVLRWNVHLMPVALLEAQAHELRGDADAANSAYEEALRVLRDDLADEAEDPRHLSATALALAGLGRRDEALALAREAVERLPTHRDALFGPPRQIDLARVYLRLGDTTAAAAEVEAVLHRPGQLTPHLLHLDPTWRPLLELPGFAPDMP